MPLVPTALASSLENDWLVAAGGGYPDSAQQSGQRFARAVSDWFAQAMANGFPCATAQARMGQLAAMAGAAFQARAAPAAGAQLALAVASYYAGQSFGAGVATFPAAGAGTSAFTAVFGNHDLPVSARAQQMATACHVMAVSTVVVFPPPMPPGPVV